MTVHARAGLRPFALGTFSFAFLAALWQLLASTGVLNEFVSSSPARVVSAASRQIDSGTLTRALGTSLGELGIGFAMATVVGIGLGLVIGWYRSAEYAVDPFISLGYSAPFIALYPVFTVLFGLGRPTVIVTCFLLAVFPVLVNTSRGIKNVDPTLIQVARSFGARDRQIFRKVSVPAAAQPIMAGLRLGVGQALLGVVIGELFAGNGGVGYDIAYYGGLLRTDDMIVSVVVIGILGVLLTTVVALIERRLDAWRPELTHD